MTKKLILMVDNHPDFLNTRAEYIDQAGYRVLKAGSAEEAQLIVETDHPDLAILDLRLIDDSSESDIGGLVLAESFRELCPVIILTDFPSYEFVRRALKPNVSGKRLAVDFVDKTEGPETLINVVDLVLKKKRKNKILQ